MKSLGAKALEMRKDFLVVNLLPKCFHCEKYIVDPERYRCSLSRENNNKTYVLCGPCYNALPDTSKKLDKKNILLRNSVSDILTEEMRKLTVIKDYSTEWPPSEQKADEKDGGGKEEEEEGEVTEPSDMPDSFGHSNKEGETTRNDSDENNGRLYFVCINPNGVACRNSPAIDDRCEGNMAVYNHERVAGTLTEDGQWICIVESKDEKQNGTFLPHMFFEKITTIKLAKEKKVKEAAQLLIAPIPIIPTWKGVRKFVKEVLPR